ncbi:MAG: antitoxin Xre/MbcA/ParS toxin-binding domain-containing protein [Dehalococcoidia bacterium]
MSSTSALATRVRELSAEIGLTQSDVGQIVGSSSRSVSRWWSGQSVPQRSKQQRLLELTYVLDAVSTVLDPEDAHMWFFSPNRLLDHDSPADRIRAGDFRSVLALIEALADGVFV